MKKILLLSALLLTGCVNKERDAVPAEACEGCCCVECVKDCNTKGNCKCQPPTHPTKAEMDEAAANAAAAGGGILVIPGPIFQ